MKCLRSFAALLPLMMMLSVVSLAQPGKTAAVKEIDAFRSTVDAIVKKRKTPDRVFADTAGMDDAKSKWRSFASPKALERFRKRSETYIVAYNWLDGGTISASNFTFFSASGDWVKYVNHYFRADGSLALVESDYRTFNGDFMVVRRRYFDPVGRLVSKSVKFLDLKTRKPKDARSGVMGDDPNEVDYFKKTSKLPFAHLLKGK